MKTIAIALAAIAAGGHALRDQGVRKREQELSETTSERRSLWWWWKDPAKKCAHYEHMVDHYEAKLAKYGCEQPTGPEWTTVTGAGCHPLVPLIPSQYKDTVSLDDAESVAECKKFCSEDQTYNSFERRTKVLNGDVKSITCYCYNDCPVKASSSDDKPRNAYYNSDAKPTCKLPNKQFTETDVDQNGVMTLAQACVDIST